MESFHNSPQQYSTDHPLQKSIKSDNKKKINSCRMQINLSFRNSQTKNPKVKLKLEIVVADVCFPVP